MCTACCPAPPAVELRLSNGTTPRSGRIEVKKDGVWGTGGDCCGRWATWRLGACACKQRRRWCRRRRLGAAPPLPLPRLHANKPRAAHHPALTLCPVCDDEFGNQEASLVCARLGFPAAGIAHLAAYYGQVRWRWRLGAGRVGSGGWLAPGPCPWRAAAAALCAGASLPTSLQCPY